MSAFQTGPIGQRAPNGLRRGAPEWPSPALSAFAGCIADPSQRLRRGCSSVLAWLAIALLAAALQGCAGHQAFREGQALIESGEVEAGIARLEDAVRQQPGNAEYRLALATRRAMYLQRLFNAAEQARREDRTADAEKGYRRVIELDPNHVMARQALEQMASAARQRALVAEAEALFSSGGLARSAAAMDRVRAVLAVEPRNKAALRLKERIGDAQVREQKADNRLAEAFRKPITLQFNDAPLRAIFDAVSRLSGLSFFFDKDVRADARGTILARSTTVEDAVRLLLMTNQLDQKVLNDSSLLVYPNTPQKQKEYQTLVVRSFFLANGDVKGVSNAIKTIVKTKDLVIDERLGTILMRDTPDAVRVAERIVALHDLGDPEVMLEVEVLEIKRSKLQDLGLQWPGSLTLSPLPSTGTTTTLADLRNLRSTTIQATLASMVLAANRQDQNANLLTNPRIRVRNKEKAKIQIGDRVPVITTTTSGTASFVSESVTYLDVGLKLEVEPTIYLDDEVAIKLNLEVSNLVKEVVSRSGTLSYQIGTRGASTVLRLKDGETQVLAGLISDEDRSTANKVPGLGELPLLGRLFGSQKDDDQRSEILLSITPRILRSLQRPELALAEFEAGTENAVGLPPLRLQRVENAAEARPGAAASAAVVPPTPAPGAAMPAPVPGPAAGGRAALLPPAPAAATRPGGPVAGFAATAPPAPPSPPALPAPTVTPQGMPIGDAPRLLWQGPSQVAAGQVVTVLLRGQGAGGWTELPLQIGFDPQALELTELRAGAMFDPADGSGSLLQQGDAQQGLLRLTLARPAEAAPAQPAPGGPPADLLLLTFKALRGGANTALQLRAADPQPQPALPLVMPTDHVLRLLP